jgi:IclR family pca regulon transcriptional regulator
VVVKGPAVDRIRTGVHSEDRCAENARQGRRHRGGATTDPEGTEGSESAARKSSDFVQSLERGLAVIRAFGPERPRLTLSDVARETGLTRAAARRFLLTLAELGYVRTNGREFSLAPRVLELGYAYLSSTGLPEIAYPHVERLVDQVRESSSISVLEGEEVVDIVRVPAKRIMTVAVPVGTRFPAFASSKGRVLLADLPADGLDSWLADAHLAQLTSHTVTDPDRLREILADVAHRGYAIVDQEVEDGIRSVAVPLHDADGGVVAAMNVSAYSRRLGVDGVKKELLPHLLETASRIEEDLKVLHTQRHARDRQT